MKPGQVSFEHKAGRSQQGMQALGLHDPGLKPVHQRPSRKSGFRVGWGSVRSEEPPRVGGPFLSVYVYAYGHPPALRLQVHPGASSKPQCPLRTHPPSGSTEEVHAPSRPGLDAGSHPPASPGCCGRADGPHSFPATILAAAWIGWQGLQGHQPPKGGTTWVSSLCVSAPSTCCWAW